MTAIIQCSPTIPLMTSKGAASAHFLIDCGEEHRLLFVCFIDETGEQWTFRNDEVRLQRNETMRSSVPASKQPKPDYDIGDVVYHVGLFSSTECRIIRRVYNGGAWRYDIRSTDGIVTCECTAESLSRFDGTMRPLSGKEIHPGVAVDKSVTRRFNEGNEVYYKSHKNSLPYRIDSCCCINGEWRYDIVNSHDRKYWCHENSLELIPL